MKLDFDEVMERLSEERYIQTSDVLASVLRRRVWLAEWHLPGCLSESQSVCTSKRDAIESALSMADYPRGMKTSLQKYGRFDSRTEMYGDVINTVTQVTISDLLL